MLQAKSGVVRTQMSAIKLSSANIAFWVVPLSPFSRTPLLTLSTVTCSRRRGNLLGSLGSLMRSVIVLSLCTIVGRSSEDCKCSDFLQRHYASIS